LHALLIGLASVVVVWLALILGLILVGRRTAARELAKLLPNLLSLFRGLIRDPRVPRRSKLLLIFAAVWIASPIDLIPEFIPFLGPLDDAVVAALVLRHVLRRAGSDVVAEHWRGDPATLQRLLRIFAARSKTSGADGGLPHTDR
jgi:uncharacterized membrane protein YkvA (DUF1232 family)